MPSCQSQASASRRRAARISAVLCITLATGCASTQVSDREEYQGARLPRPGRIIVRDFAATPADIPAWSEARKRYADAGADMDADDLAAGRELGAYIAARLVEKLDDMGLEAVRSAGRPEPQLDDIVIIGYFSSLDEGSGGERVLIGFGSGASKLGVHAEGYRMTDHGLVKLGSGSVGGEGGKSPGLLVPALVTIATANPIGLVVSGTAHVAGEVSGRSGARGDASRIADEIASLLERKFEEQGWI